MTLSEPQLDISNSFLLQLIISNCIYAFKLSIDPDVHFIQCMLPQTMCSCCRTLHFHFLEFFIYLYTSISFPTKRTLSILTIDWASLWRKMGVSRNIPDVIIPTPANSVAPRSSGLASRAAELNLLQKNIVFWPSSKYLVDLDHDAVMDTNQHCIKLSAACAREIILECRKYQ